ncbi:hypothetical protein GCM10027200_30730 [Lentzea nigeriaca]
MTAAVVLAFGGATTGAAAQEPSAPPSTSDEPAPSPSSAQPPAEPEPPKDSGEEKKAALPDLKVTGTLDKSDYHASEPVRVTMTVTNQSDVAAAQVRGTIAGIAVDDAQWGDFAWRTGGGRLAPGETRTIEVSGIIRQLEPTGRLLVSGGLQAADGDANPSDNHFLLPGVAAPQMRGTVRFDKSSYELHETVRFWLTVTNIGGQPAEGVKLDWPIGSVDLPANVWGDFSPSGAGIRLAAGESRTFEGSGKIRDLRDGRLEVSGSINYVGRADLNDSRFSGQVDVVRTTGELSGVVYTDKNRNGQHDPGEGAAGAEVWANGGVPSVNIKTTTDAEGRFSFSDLSSGNYYVNYSLAGGWIVHAEGPNGTVRVEPGAPVRLVARAERPYTESLSATLTLDKNVYRAGEEARITITITNSGDHEISGIRAFCHREGRGGNHLGPQPSNPRPTGWGDLVGRGVTVGPGETGTFIATENVPPAALTYGRVIGNCGFAPHAQWNLDVAMATDSARVVGGFGVLKGNLFYDRNRNWVLDEGEGIGNTRIVLRDRELGVDVAETVSDDQGHVRFDRAPAGEYVAWVDGPWKFEDVNGHVQVLADREQDHDFIVVPGPRPGTGGGPPAAGVGSGSGSGEALAKTGAGVLGLGLVGALLVAFGFGASIVGRRRTA